MTELEKLDAGLEYDFWDEGVNSRKLRAIEVCGRLEKIPQTDKAARAVVIKELFAHTGKICLCCRGSTATMACIFPWGKTFSAITT